MQSTILVENKIEKRTKKQAFLICALASLFYFYEFFLRVIPSVISHDLMREFELGTFGIGIFMSAFYLGYTPMQIPAGLLLDRFGPKRVLSLAVLIAAYCTYLFANTNNLHIALAARFFIGFSSSFAYLGALILATRWFDPKYFAMGAGFIQVLGCMGALVGQAPVALATEAVGWRPTMNYAAIICFFLGLLYILILKDAPKKDQAIKLEPSPFNLKHQLQTVCQNRQVWAIAFFAFTVWAPMTILAESWGARFLMSRFDFSGVEAASALSTVWIGVAAGGPLMGWWSSTRQSRCQPLWLGSILGLLSSSIILFLPVHWPVLLVALFLFGFAASSQAVTFGLIHDLLPQKVAGTAVGFNNMAVIFGGMSCQPLAAFMLEKIAQDPMHPSTSDYQTALIIIPCLYLIGMITHGFFIQETHCRNQHEEFAHEK